MIFLVVRTSDEEASKESGWGCTRISINSSKKDFICEFKNVLCVSDYSIALSHSPHEGTPNKNARSGNEIATRIVTRDLG